MKNQISSFNHPSNPHILFPVHQRFSLHELVEFNILLEEEARGGVGERVGEVQAQVERGVGGSPDLEPGLPALSAGELLHRAPAEEEAEQEGHGNAGGALLETVAVRVVEAWVPEGVAQVDLAVVCDLQDGRLWVRESELDDVVAFGVGEAEGGDDRGSQDFKLAVCCGGSVVSGLGGHLVVVVELGVVLLGISLL